MLCKEIFCRAQHEHNLFSHVDVRGTFTPHPPRTEKKKNKICHENYTGPIWVKRHVNISRDFWVGGVYLKNPLLRDGLGGHIYCLPECRGS